MPDDDYLPIPDKCAYSGCGLPRAEHTGWDNGVPRHGFEEPMPAVNPERIAGSFIETTWTCTHCGAGCDVWGVADNEWMECVACGKQSFVMVDFSTSQSEGSDT